MAVACPRRSRADASDLAEAAAGASAILLAARSARVSTLGEGRGNRPTALGAPCARPPQAPRRPDVAAGTASCAEDACRPDRLPQLLPPRRDLGAGPVCGLGGDLLLSARATARARRGEPDLAGRASDDPRTAPPVARLRRDDRRRAGAGRNTRPARAGSDRAP